MDPVAQFFCKLQQTWQQVAQCCPPRTFFYTVAGQGVQCHFAGEGLAQRLTPALAHLHTTAPQPAMLTLYGWDSAESGVALPPLPFPVGEEQASTDSWGYFTHNHRFRLFFQPAQQTLCLFDQVSNVGFYWVGDAQHLSLTDGGAPLLTLWHWWATQHGSQVVHGAAIGTATGGALLVGKSGSGKSTTALAALDAGLCYVGDDYCLVRPGAQPMVYSLFSSGKVHFADRARFPRLQAGHTPIQYTNADKALFFFARHFIHTVVPALPLKMILLPVVRPQTHASLCAISPAQALLALAPSTLFQLVGEKTQTMQQLSRLVRQLPCFQLSLGADLAQIPALIVERLATL